MVEVDEKVDLEFELNKIYKSIVKGVDVIDRVSIVLLVGISISKVSLSYVVGSNDRWEFIYI